MLVEIVDDSSSVEIVEEWEEVEAPPPPALASPSSAARADLFAPPPPLGDLEITLQGVCKLRVYVVCALHRAPPHTAPAFAPLF